MMNNDHSPRAQSIAFWILFAAMAFALATGGPYGWYVWWSGQQAPVVQQEPTTTTATTTVTTLPDGMSSMFPTNSKKEVPGNELTAENVLISVNNARIDAGMAPLVRTARLDSAAQLHLDDMLTKGYFAHTSPSGVIFQQWIVMSGYQYLYAGENLARNYADMTETMQAWMASPEHKANILKPEYTETGIAVHGSYAVQIFASERN